LKGLYYDARSEKHQIMQDNALQHFHDITHLGHKEDKP